MPAKSTRRMRPLLGTYVEVGVWHGDADSSNASIDAAFKAIECVHTSLSFHDAASELSRLNQAAGKYVSLSPLALRVLRLARAMTVASNGLFNCTVGGALVDRGRLPRHGHRVHLAVGHAQDIDIQATCACLLRPVLITLDGIAKGYAVDRAVMAMKRGGMRSGWVNAGGDIRVYGDGVLPLHVRGQTGGAHFGLQNAALATSVTTSSFDAGLPGEIIRTANLQCALGRWSVMARSAWRADALTKVAALVSEAERDELIHKLGGRCVSFDEPSGALAA